jgi:enoyl-CoA hydratase/carnithine racemase
LNRPHRANALDWDLGERLRAAVERLAAQDDLRAVVIRGAGGSFCSGGDLAFIEENTGLPPGDVERRMRRFYRMFLSVLDLPVPTVAVIQGSAIGAGLCLALACDIRIGSIDARLGLGFGKLGLHPGMGATALVPHLAPGRASDLLLTGDAIDGIAGERCGLLSRVAARDELDAVTDRVIASLLSTTPLAARQTVATLRAPRRLGLDTALDREARHQRDNFAGSEVPAAVAAFRARRASPKRSG